MYKPLARQLVLQPCKQPFTVNKLMHPGQVNAEKQNEIGWGIVLAAGADAVYAGESKIPVSVGDVVFFPNGQETRIAMDQSLIRLLVDSFQVIGTWNGAVEASDREASVSRPAPTELEQELESSAALVNPDGTPIN